MKLPLLTPMPSMPRARLRGFERVSVAVLEAINRRPPLRRALHFVSGWSFASVVAAATARRWQLFGLDAMQALDAADGVILAANHRSFFDLFVASTALKFNTRLLRSVAYPVRAEFFYTHPLGVALNFAVAGASMWPPVFRDDRRRELNPVGFEQLARTLGPGCVIGIHPEGTRNKGDDPYAFLPRKVGLGQLVLGCAPRVCVVPVFLGGLSNDWLGEFRRSYAPSAQPRPPIRVWFGAAIRAADLQPLGDPLAITEAVFAQVQELAAADREWLTRR